MKISNLGEFISETYRGFLELYGDEELASVATAALINDLLTKSIERSSDDVAA